MLLSTGIRTDKLSELLNTRDHVLLKAASYENKASLLYALTENYDQSTSQKLRGLADYISDTALKRMAELQDMAVRSVSAIS